MKPRDCNADCAKELLISQRKYFLCPCISVCGTIHIYVFVFKMDYKFMA